MKSLFNSLILFQAIASKFPINAAVCLLWIAEHEPCLKSDMELALGLSMASGSRNTDYLSKVNRLRKPGLDFIKKEENPDNRRQTLLTLTSKGREFINKLKGEAYALERSG